MDRDDLPRSYHLKRHGGEDLDDDHVHEIQRDRGDGLADKVDQQLWVLENHQDLSDNLHTTETHGHVHVDELVPEIPGHDGGLDLALELDAFVVPSEEVEDEGQHQQTDQHDEHREILLLILWKVCSGCEVVD